MPRHELRITLLQMRDHAAEAVDLAQSRTRPDLDENRLLNLALVRLVELVGEAAGRVPVEERARHSSIPWPEIIGMRNRLVHAYDEVDLDLLWQVVRVDPPSLVTELERILARFG